jgi:phenylacetate-CoA ligase
MTVANNYTKIYDPEVETRSRSKQRLLDESAFRKQVIYLFDNSRFYKNKLNKAGFKNAKSVGGLNNLNNVPLSTKDELRKSQAEEAPLGSHCAAPLENIARIYSTSGTSGVPMYIPLTQNDLKNWIITSHRSYTAAGILKNHRVLTTYNSGPFVAGAVGESLQSLGVNIIPIGTGNTERLVRALNRFQPDAIPGTPSFLLYIAETAKRLGVDPSECGLKTLICGGEPGAAEKSLRSQLENLYRAKVHEVMGIGDISISIWGEAEEQLGMHFCAQDFVHVELIDPKSEKIVPIEDGATGELVYTHLRHEAAPLLRFRSRDHVIVYTKPVGSGRTGIRIRCIGRTDDMLIVRGVNVFPSAVREVVSDFCPEVSGLISIRPSQNGVKQSPPLPILVELNQGRKEYKNLQVAIETAIREKLVFKSKVSLVPYLTLDRSEYKSKLVDYKNAQKLN